jgi:hypothetical protein
MAPARVTRFAPRHARQPDEHLREGDRVAGVDGSGTVREGTVLDNEHPPGQPWIGAHLRLATDHGEQHLVPVQWDAHEMVDAATLRRI